MMEEFNVTNQLDSKQEPAEVVERRFPFFKILYRNIWFIIIVTILCTALGVFYDVTKTKPYYTSSCDLILSVSLEDDLNSGVKNEQNLSDLGLSKSYVETIKEIILSPVTMNIANQVYLEKHGSNGYIGLGNIAISTQANSLVMGLTYTDGDIKVIDKKLEAVIIAANRVTADEDSEKINAKSIALEPMQNDYEKVTYSNKGAYISIGLIGGLAISVVISCLLYVFDNKVKETSELEHLTGVSILAVISNADK